MFVFTMCAQMFSVFLSKFASKLDYFASVVYSTDC